MNCDTDAIIVAMNVFSHPMMINANLFTDNCINIAIKCFPLIPLYHRCSTAFWQFTINEYAICYSCHVHRCSRGVEVLLSEQWDKLFLHEWHDWFSAEMGRRNTVLCNKKFNAADHHRCKPRSRVSTVHCQLLIRHTRSICLAWRSRSSCWQLFQMALDWRTVVRYGSLVCVKIRLARFELTSKLSGLKWFRMTVMHIV